MIYIRVATLGNHRDIIMPLSVPGVYISHKRKFFAIFDILLIFLFYVYIFLVLLIGIALNTFFMHIKLKTILRLTHAHKYKAIKFRFCCDYNVNMNRIMLAISILHKIHYNYYKCKTS